MKKPQKYYSKRRDNPQLGSYYVAMGQMSATAAKANEKSLYGMNFMRGFDTEAEYFAALDSLKEDGFRVQGDHRAKAHPLTGLPK